MSNLVHLGSGAFSTDAGCLRQLTFRAVLRAAAGTVESCLEGAGHQLISQGGRRPSFWDWV